MESLVSSDWLKENINNPNIIILDATLVNQRAKQPETIKNIQIKGARYFDLKFKFSDVSNDFPTAFPEVEQFEKEAQLLGINDTSIIVVYDANGTYSCARVWWLFKCMGHKNVAVLNGGLPNWVTNQYPTEALNLDNLFTKGNFKVNTNFKLVRKFKDVFNNVESKNELIVDVRAANRYNCLVPEPKEGLRMGTIPDSYNIPYTDVLENGKFKTENHLKTIFEPLFKENRNIVFSCGSGITACIVLLAAQKVLKNELAVYDGSWTEWGTLVE